MALSNIKTWALPRNFLQQIGWVLGILVFAFAIISAVERKGASVVGKVEADVIPLKGDDRLINEDNIKAVILNSFGYELEGLKIEEVNLERLEQVLENEPFILNADVYADGRSNIQIRVTQRAPVLRIMGNNNQNYYLDKTGYQMPLSDLLAAKVLIATGNLAPYQEDFLDKKRNTLKDVFLLAEVIRADAFLNAMIEQIHVSNKGDMTLIPKLGNQKIIFGKLDNVENKFRRLKTFYKEAMPYEGWRKFEVIDLQYKNQVVCKR
ncbi:MAG TPA: hypothetical protein PKA00_02765 [Saprospiraceae bacterium]|nr:hypothetical protein [Saprospiraceae bacterium]HMQ81796.1 hypothetical protein [Saprospiraceae bacterium]